MCCARSDPSAQRGGIYGGTARFRSRANVTRAAASVLSWPQRTGATTNVSRIGKGAKWTEKGTKRTRKGHGLGTVFTPLKTSTPCHAPTCAADKNFFPAADSSFITHRSSFIVPSPDPARRTHPSPPCRVSAHAALSITFVPLPATLIRVNPCASVVPLVCAAKRTHPRAARFIPSVPSCLCPWPMRPGASPPCLLTDYQTNPPSASIRLHPRFHNHPSSHPFRYSRRTNRSASGAFFAR